MGKIAYIFSKGNHFKYLKIFKYFFNGITFFKTNRAKRKWVKPTKF